MKICIDAFSPLPIPSVKGGAIETLLGIIIDENEKYQKLNINIISSFDKDALNISKKLVYSKITYIKQNEVFRKIFDKIIYLSNKLLKRLNSKWDIGQYTYYNQKRLKIMKKSNADLYIILGPNPIYLSLVEKYGIEKILFYMHYAAKANEISDNIVKNVLGVSEYVINNYFKTSRYDSNNGKVLLNCIDESLFIKKISDIEKIQIREKLGFSKDDFIVIFAGRINEEKGLTELIKAIKSINNVNIKLLICGGVLSGKKQQSEYLDYVIEECKNSDNRMVYTGYIRNDELYKYYYISDVQVVPTIIEEAAGLVAIEGMMCGLPIIATRTGGLPEYIGEEKIYFVDKDNLSSDLALYIEKIYRSIEIQLEMANYSKERSKKFTKESFYELFVKSINLFCIKNK